jgi:hypothetical protein
MFTHLDPHSPGSAFSPSGQAAVTARKQEKPMAIKTQWHPEELRSAPCRKCPGG